MTSHTPYQADKESGNAPAASLSRFPGFDFADEIVWLYEQAKGSYEMALRLDPIDSVFYIEISKMLEYPGNTTKANRNRRKALATLNGALQADNNDEESYAERAIVFEELGQIDQAIADLQRVLALSTRDYRIDTFIKTIEELHQSKDNTTHA